MNNSSLIRRNMIKRILKYNDGCLNKHQLIIKDHMMSYHLGILIYEWNKQLRDTVVYQNNNPANYTPGIKPTNEVSNLEYNIEWSIINLLPNINDILKRKTISINISQTINFEIFMVFNKTKMVYQFTDDLVDKLTNKMQELYYK
jgi:hypothetical protein